MPNRSIFVPPPIVSNCEKSSRMVIDCAHSGAAYVFARDGERWVLEQKLTPPHAEVGGFFGSAIALEGERARDQRLDRRLRAEQPIDRDDGGGGARRAAAEPARQGQPLT